MIEFIYRTEDIKPEDVPNYFVETVNDRIVIDALKGRNPIILVGSRGIGKSFLLRICEQELLAELPDRKIFPVYLTFRRSSLIHTSDSQQFTNWMLAKTCYEVVRSLARKGLLTIIPRAINYLVGEQQYSPTNKRSRVEELASKFENSWKNPGLDIDASDLITIDGFKDAIEDICGELSIDRMVLLIDEAAHILLPDQQRQFFTLFRDLRTPYISAKAAVYPGVTNYGPTFQPAHDATLLSLNRNLLSSNYTDDMLGIVARQADSKLMNNIAHNKQNFAVLAYAASGNPRTLLKTIARSQTIRTRASNDVIKEYYRTEIWAEHSKLAETYVGHRDLIDWGRRFIESHVIPDIAQKNADYVKNGKPTSIFFWIHRDTPESVKEALRILEYTGIVTEHASGIRATRAEIGTRYIVNVGCLIAQDAYPIQAGFGLVRDSTPKRMSEYGMNHDSYEDIRDFTVAYYALISSDILKVQLGESMDVLDITDYQKVELRKLALRTIGDVLGAPDEKLMEMPYVGEIRSRKISNAAMAAVFEYLSG